MTVIIHAYGGAQDGLTRRTNSSNYRQGDYVVAKLSRPTLRLVYKYKARQPWNGETHVNVFLVGILRKTKDWPPKQQQTD